MTIATHLPGAAYRLPCWKGHREAFETMLRGTVRIIRRAVERAGEEFLDNVREENERLGIEIGEMLLERYPLSRDIEGAVRLIELQIIPFDIRMRVLERGKHRALMEKLTCPLWDMFRREGVDFCDVLCLPATRGAVRALDPHLCVGLSRPPGEGCYCVKFVEKVDEEERYLGEMQAL